MNFLPNVQWGRYATPDLDAIRKPGALSIEEMVKEIEEMVKARKEKPKAPTTLDKIDHLANNLMSMYELIRVTRDPEARRSLLKAALDLSQRILAARRQYEFERHEATIQDVNRQSRELQEIATTL